MHVTQVKKTENKKEIHTSVLSNLVFRAVLQMLWCIIRWHYNHTHIMGYAFLPVVEPVKDASYVPLKLALLGGL